MQHFLSIPVGDHISFKIPNTWVEEVGDPGEYAFISGDGDVFMTVIFIGFDPSDTTSLKDILEQATGTITEMADFTAPLVQTEKYVARYIQMGDQNMLFAMTEGFSEDSRIVANLFFKTEDLEAYEKNRTLINQIIGAVEIKS